MKKQIRSEDAVTYTATSPTIAAEDATIAAALRILESRLKIPGYYFSDPTSVKQYCRLWLSAELAEKFGVLFLNNRNGLIASEVLFTGTIDGASVHPREVVRACIAHNAAAVIFTHNHPSGITDPSQADIQITGRLKDALALIDVRVLDHIIVGSRNAVSLAEQGKI